MTLEGSLDAFSLPDIFQLLSFTKKTGALRIHAANAEGVVHFTTGAVTGASSDTARHSLARRLVGAGLVADDTLDAALAAVREDPATGIGTALRDTGAVDEGVLHEVVTEQATDAVFDLLRWEQGDFAFVEEANPDDLGVALGVEEIISEGRKRLETWSTLVQAVPSPEAVVAVPLNPAGDTVSLTPEEWSLLALVDGRRRVRDLVVLSGRGEYATVQTLASLVGRGLLVVKPTVDDITDGVSALLRRQRALAELEGRPDDLPVEAPADEEAAVAPVRREPPRPRRVTEAAPPVVPTRADPPVRLAGDVQAARAAMQPKPAAGGPALSAVPRAGAPIEHDPNVNKSLLLRLIAGVRGL